ncbi:MAG: class I cytochrome c [Comamonadaceae bacterium PBBC2]|nr:MAG: class I cytochrome c [Comamonadaceae bacterium PBBC2]
MRFPVRVLVTTAASLLAIGANASDLAKVRSLAASCANCHGTNGVAQPGMVSLAGQPKDLLLSNLMDFKSGKRPATIMHQLAKGYTDEQLAQMATYFASQKP